MRGGRYERCDELIVAPRLDPGDELVGLHGIPDLRCGLASTAHAPGRAAVTKMTYAGAGVRCSLRPCRSELRQQPLAMGGRRTATHTAPSSLPEPQASFGQAAMAASATPFSSTTVAPSRAWTAIPWKTPR